MKTLAQRWKAIDLWCYRRGVRQQFAFFKGCDPSIEKYYTRIRMVATSGKDPVEEDTPWIESMELTIAMLRDRSKAAA